MSGPAAPQIGPVSSAPVENLKRLCVVIDGEWIERDGCVGILVRTSEGSIDIEYRQEDACIRVSAATGTDSLYFTSWEAPVANCRLQQQPDDGNLLTELVAEDSTGGCQGRLSWWGPPARYRGGAIRIEPREERQNYILTEVEPK